MPKLACPSFAPASISSPKNPSALAEARGARSWTRRQPTDYSLGVRPDTFLSGVMQTCRKLIDGGAIGEPIAASVFFMERDSPYVKSDRAFVLQRGGGAMLDMGVYFVTALVSLLGPIRWVTGMTKTPFPERVLTDGPQKGNTMPVTVATHTIGAMEFVNGVLASVVTSTDISAGGIPPMLLHGTNGTLRAPHPNGVRGPVHILRETNEDWDEASLTHRYALPFLGVGVADLGQAIAPGRPHRASGDLAFHVLDTMLAFEDSARARTQVELQSECHDRPRCYRTLTRGRWIGGEWAGTRPVRGGAAVVLDRDICSDFLPRDGGCRRKVAPAREELECSHGRSAPGTWG